jgi:DNA-binding HxlR family transcriptional regulator
MTNSQYGLFCPLAMACEILEPRWTILILGEMSGGASRFNEIRRGVPGISPTLLSRRLREMEANGLVERLEDPGKGTVDYIRTPKATELQPALRMLAEWAYKHIESEVALDDLNPDYLMWNIRRKLDASQFPKRRVVIRFHFTDVVEERASNWIIARPSDVVELCMTDPKFDVDLYVDANSRALASVWMGYSTLRAEMSRDRIFLSGDPYLTKTIDRWLVRSSYAAAAE